MLARLLEPSRALAARGLRIPVVAELAEAVAQFDRAGGSLIASALAYRAIFALLAGLVFACGLIGWAFDDPGRRDAAIQAISAAIPGLEAVARDGLAKLASGRDALSVVGFLASAWAASQFYDVLDDAITRAIPGGRARGTLRRRWRGILAVLALALAGLLALVVRFDLQATAVLVEDGLPRLAIRVIEFGLGFALLAVGLLAVYRFVPVVPPTVRAAALPAFAAAAAIGIAAELFSALAPILVTNLQIFGVAVSLLAVLVWLGWACRILLVGAAWASVRRDAQGAPGERPGGGPELDSAAR
ncbi:MAG: YhjD/YihY/BrkB family envelope integrity protein [Candidatus Limnocylindrales bacterium]